MRFARWVFRLSGLYGLVLLTPLYFLEGAVARSGAPMTHPEYYYGFIGTALSAQLLFLIISTDPVRFRPAMVAGVAEKLAFGVPVWLLWAQGRATPDILLFGSIDLVWAGLFTAAYFRTSPARLSAARGVGAEPSGA